MVRTTTADGESNTNDATRFVSEQIQSRKSIEDFDAVDKVGGHHTAESGMLGSNGDFDDDGMYDGDDPVDVVLRVTVDGDAPAHKVQAVVGELADLGFDVSGPDVKRSYTSPMDTSGGGQRAVLSPPEDDDEYNHRFKYEARKRVHDGNDDDDDSIWQAANAADRRLADDDRL